MSQRFACPPRPQVRFSADLAKGGRRRGATPGLALAVALAVGCLGGAALLAATPVMAQPVGNATPYDGELFSLTNQDRTSNGLAALADNAVLSEIGQDRPYYGCSVSPIYGRAADMLTRDYFAHQIPGCTADGGYVWPIMSADGVAWRSAGENIGWNNGYADPASAINTAFMNSPAHRANIMGNYNQLGIGSWYTPGPWNYPGSGSSGLADVYMFAEEFALVGSSAPPPPPPTPPPSSGGGGSSSSGGSHATPTPAPTTVATPTPTPTPKPKPKPRPGVGSEFPQSSRGLLSSTIEQVISGYLDE